VEKTAKPEMFRILNVDDKSKSSELVLLRLGRCREKLTVRAPRRFALLTETQNPSVQTIPFKRNML
jgi:hypothetical protein